LEKEMINRSEYPKWIGDKLARSEEEEETVLSEQVAAAEAENAKLQAKKDAEAKKKAEAKAAADKAKKDAESK
jgi:hypothetical protein